MTSAFDLPEIRECLSKYLTRHDLVSCARVSSEWNKSFEWHIWTELNIGPKPQDKSDFVTALPRSILDRHKDSIQTLVLRKTSSNDQQDPTFFLRDLYCPRLKNLDVHWNSSYQEHLLFLGRHSRTLTHLSVDLFVLPGTGQGSVDSEDFWQLASSCLSLESLTARRVFVTNNSWPTCWKLWSRLTCLRLRRVVFRLLAMQNNDNTSMGNKTGDIITGPLTLLLDDSPYTSTSIKDLELINLEGLSHFEDQLALARFCPDLETFIWDDTSTDDPPSVRTQYLKDLANYCPKLKSLSVHGSFEEEVHGVYSFLRARPHIPLKVLEIPHHAFGELLWQVVKENHASTLTTVDLSFSPTITGELSHEIMCALPNLESLKVPTIKDRDLVRDRRPWICHRLQHLTIGFQFVVESRTLFSPLSSSSSSSLPEKDNRKMVFERLGTLRFLKTLNIRELDYDVQPLGGLRFQLKDGLDFLKTLQQLEELELWNGNQELSKTDVQWMVDHWPRLRILFGKLHSSKVSSTAYTRLLLAHGIKPWASIPKAVYIS